MTEIYPVGLRPVTETTTLRAACRNLVASVAVYYEYTGVRPIRFFVPDSTKPREWAAVDMSLVEDGTPSSTTSNGQFHFDIHLGGSDPFAGREGDRLADQLRDLGCEALDTYIIDREVYRIVG